MGAAGPPPSLQESGPPPFWESSLPAAAWLQGTHWRGGSTEKGVLGCEVMEGRDPRTLEQEGGSRRLGPGMTQRKGGLGLMAPSVSRWSPLEEGPCW